MSHLHSKHIVFITPGFAASQDDTSSVTYFLNYLEALQKEAEDLLITVIATEYPFVKSTYQWHKADVYTYGLYKKSKLKKISAGYEIYTLIKKLHKNQPIDIIHSLWLKKEAFLTQIIAKRLKIPYLQTAMGMEFVTTNRYLRWIDMKHVVFVSHRQYQSSQTNNNGSEPRIIPWGVIQRSEVLSERDIDILFVGYLNENKNLNQALQIIKQITNSMPKLTVRIVGDYFNLDDWKTVVVGLGLEQNVQFLGRINNDEVIKQMQRSKVLLHTSNYESLGYAMLEALSCGMYVVSKAVGIAESSEHWSIAHTTEEFVHTISQLLDNYHYPGTSIPYPISETVKAYIEMYNKCRMT